jgi:hypothetical protein
MPSSGFLAAIAVILSVVSIALGWSQVGNPPSFHAVLPARTAENARSVAYDDPQLPELQKNAYPDLAPIKAALSWSEAFDRALYVAKTMPGWTIVASDPDADRIEAKPAKSLVRIH